MNTRPIIDAILAGEDAQQVFKMLPFANGIAPYGLRQMFRVVAECQHQLSQMTDATNEVKEDITETRTSSDGWPEAEVSQFVKAVRRGLRMKLTKMVEEALA